VNITLALQERDDCNHPALYGLLSQTAIPGIFVFDFISTQNVCQGFVLINDGTIKNGTEGLRVYELVGTSRVSNDAA
jgi:hypothetical protein